MKTPKIFLLCILTEAIARLPFVHDLQASRLPLQWATTLTNSLEATDVAAVHAGYAKRRRPLLESGIALYEMKRSFSQPTLSDRGLADSSGSSLHAKTFSVDRSRIFIGSFNFDPRSTHLNTENGFVIESPAMAQVLADAFVSSVPARAYQVRLSDAGSLQWIERHNGETVVHNEEPGAGFWRRSGVFFLSLLPIEWLL